MELGFRLVTMDNVVCIGSFLPPSSKEIKENKLKVLISTNVVKRRTARDPPSICSGIEGGALQRWGETHVLSFHGSVGFQLLLLLNSIYLTCCTLSKFSHWSRE